MKTLTLSLKKQWFDKIKSGEKKEEYRECSEYWITRFSKLCGKFVMIYAGSHPNCIRIGTGRPEWGAEPGKNYFVITWEEL